MNEVYQTYQDQAILTASREQLVVMLYDGCIRFMKQAKNLMEQQKLDQANQKLLRAQAIISELMSTLNMEYEVSHQLFSLYDYFRRRLIEANLKKSQEPIDEVINFVTDLRQTWEQAMKMCKSGNSFSSGQSIRI